MRAKYHTNLTTASTNCCPFGTERFDSGRNSFASYLHRIHFSFSSRDEFDAGFGRLFRIVASYTEFDSVFPIASITLKWHALNEMKIIINKK